MVEISIEDLTFIYQGSTTPALKDINLSIPQGSFMLIAGPSGSGKSTLVDCINGLIPHRYRGRVKGVVRVDGEDWFDVDYSILSQKIGLVRQDPDSQLACEDVYSEVAFGPENLCLSRSEINERVEWALKAVDGMRLIKRKIATLSGGEKQRIAIASMLTMKPEILILDEPSSFLDIPAMQTLCKNLITLRKMAPKMTIIIIDHELFNILPLIQNLIIMNQGEIYLEGHPITLITTRLDEVEKIGIRINPALLNYMKEMIPDETTESIKEGNQDYIYKKLNKKLLFELECMNEFNERLQFTGVPLLEAKNLSYTYEKNDLESSKKGQKPLYPNNKLAIKNLDFKIYEGDFISLMGNNGSGKTTLLKLLAGQLKPTKGTILYKDHELSSLDPFQYLKNSGMIFQNPEHQFFKRTVQDEIYYGPDNFNLERSSIETYVATLINHLKLDQYLSKLPFCLSWGEKRRVNMASVLSYLPSILFLDEIFIGQDLHNVMILLKVLKGLNRRLNQTIIICTHKPDLILTLANRVILMDKGEIIINGSIKENLTNIYNFFFNYN